MTIRRVSNRGRLVVALCVTASGILAMTLAIAIHRRETPVSPVATMRPGTTVEVELAAGDHELTWVGVPRQPQPDLADLELTATDDAGQSGTTEDLKLTTCTTGRTDLTECTIGQLVIREAGTYSLHLALFADDPSDGSLVVSAKPPARPTPNDYLAFLGFVLTIAGLAGLGIVFWLRMNTNWSRGEPWYGARR